MLDKSRHTLLLAALCAALVAGCGDDETDSNSAEAAATPTATEASFPAELTGTWTTTMKRSEFEELPPQFNQAGSKWEITIAEDGGVEGAPSMAMSNDKLDHFYGVTLAVADGKLEVPDETYTCGGEEVPVALSYVVTGEELTLELESGECPDDALAALLTTKPWKRG